MRHRKKARWMRKYSLEFKRWGLKDYFAGVDGLRGLARKYGIDRQTSWDG